MPSLHFFTQPTPIYCCSQSVQLRETQHNLTQLNTTNATQLNTTQHDTNQQHRLGKVPPKTCFFWENFPKYGWVGWLNPKSPPNP